eukprot:s1971_g13.t1
MQSEKVHGRDTCRFIANKSDTEQNAFPEVQKNSTCIFEVAVGLPSLAHGFSHAGWCGCRKLCLRSQLLLRACFFNTGLSSFVYARRATMLMLALCRTLGIIVVTNFVVECTPGFDAPCCSALGWCGRSAEHCKCEMCTDYRDKVKITMKRFKLHKAKREPWQREEECETISADLGEFTSPEDCAAVALKDAECGKLLMYSWNYPNWGCRCSELWALLSLRQLLAVQALLKLEGSMGVVQLRVDSREGGKQGWQASVEFGKEIAQAARWPTQIAWNTLSKSQQARGVRLFSVLKAAFADHGRITLMIQSFGEGLDIVAVAMQGDVFGNSLSYMGNGFELLRQLAKELSLRSRAEAMSLRAMLMARTFRAQDSSAPVADTVRQIEVAVARFVRLLSTLDPRDAAGFTLTDSDQLTLLMRKILRLVEVRVNCVKSRGRGVTQHMRKSERGVETEIVADFMFLDSAGETISVAEQQSSTSFKVLVLREAFSSSIGAVMNSENIAKDRSLLLKWLAEFGLSSSAASVVLLTDSEEAVKSFVANASDKYAFMVRKAAPQAHEQLGGAERAVRVLKEGLATLQSDFQSLGCVLSLRRDLLQLALTYICMSVSANGKAFGGERSPKEVAVGRKLPDTTFALFGSKVLAEVPDSVKALCPNMSRFEAAAFLHPQFGSLGSLVFAHVRVGQV